MGGEGVISSQAAVLYLDVISVKGIGKGGERERDLENDGQQRPDNRESTFYLLLHLFLPFILNVAPGILY